MNGAESGKGSRELHEVLVDNAARHAMFVLAPDGTISTWPESATEIYGYDGERVLGEHLDFLIVDRGDLETDLDRLLERARVRTVETEHWHRRVDGSEFRARLTLSPVRNEGFEGYAAVVRDVTEGTRTEQHLDRQNDGHQEIIDVLQHELRNPLNVILARVELFEETGDPEHVEQIRETTQRIERLVDDLVRFCHDDDIVEMLEPVDLGDVVDIAWEGVGTERADCEYVPVPTLLADRDRLVELLENLFRNAVEHGGRGVSVRVGPTEDGFFIEDDGPGIPTDQQSDVFDHGYSTDPDGTGFGLAIVETIADAHGWDVTVTETPLGGARFEISEIEFLDRPD